MPVTRRGFFARLAAIAAGAGALVAKVRLQPAEDAWKRERIRVFARGLGTPPGPRCTVELEAPDGRRQCAYLEPNAMFVAYRDMTITRVSWACIGTVAYGREPLVTVSRDGIGRDDRILGPGDVLSVRFS